MLLLVLDYFHMSIGKGSQYLLQPYHSLILDQHACAKIYRPIWVYLVLTKYWIHSRVRWSLPADVTPSVIPFQVWKRVRSAVTHTGCESEGGCFWWQEWVMLGWWCPFGRRDSAGVTPKVAPKCWPACGSIAGTNRLSLMAAMWETAVQGQGE